MAGIIRFSPGRQAVTVHTTEVDCHHQTVTEEHGSRYVHPSTFGSGQRKSAAKSGRLIRWPVPNMASEVARSNLSKNRKDECAASETPTERAPSPFVTARSRVRTDRNGHMASEIVDQIGQDGQLVHDVDTKLSQLQKNQLLASALPGSGVEIFSGRPVIRFRDQIILAKQITHLGRPWPGHKKRIQIPRHWLETARDAARARLRVRFIGIYHYGPVTIFVDFNPEPYTRRAANNSAAHVATNDLYQAQALGQFSRQDRGGNWLTAVRREQLAAYLLSGPVLVDPHIEIVDQFSREFLDGSLVNGLAASQEMFAANWPDKFQNEWAGFYVEFCLDRFLKRNGYDAMLSVQKEKRKGEYDYDLKFHADGVLSHYGDLKASSISVKDSPGNDAANFYRCLAETGKFWYVIFEHQTRHARDNGDHATRAWNLWRRSVGHVGRNKEFDPLSYSGRYKESVRFVRANVLEINEANAGLALKDFQAGFRQPDGSPRNPKVMIAKRNIENFLVYTHSIEDDWP